MFQISSVAPFDPEIARILFFFTSNDQLWCVLILSKYAQICKKTVDPRINASLMFISKIILIKE